MSGDESSGQQRSGRQTLNLGAARRSYARTSRESRSSACFDAEARASESTRTHSRLNAGRPSGLRLLTQFRSRTHSSSFHVAPALRISSCSVGHVVIVRPFTSPAEIRIHPVDRAMPIYRPTHV